MLIEDCFVLSELRQDPQWVEMVWKCAPIRPKSHDVLSHCPTAIWLSVQGWYKGAVVIVAKPTNCLREWMWLLRMTCKFKNKQKVLSQLLQNVLSTKMEPYLELTWFRKSVLKNSLRTCHKLRKWKFWEDILPQKLSAIAGRLVIPYPVCPEV